MKLPLKVAQGLVLFYGILISTLFVVHPSPIWMAFLMLFYALCLIPLFYRKSSKDMIIFSLFCSLSTLFAIFYKSDITMIFVQHEPLNIALLKYITLLFGLPISFFLFDYKTMKLFNELERLEAERNYNLKLAETKEKLAELAQLSHLNNLSINEVIEDAKKAMALGEEISKNLDQQLSDITLNDNKKDIPFH